MASTHWVLLVMHEWLYVAVFPCFSKFTTGTRSTLEWCHSHLWYPRQMGHIISHGENCAEHCCNWWLQPQFPHNKSDCFKITTFWRKHIVTSLKCMWPVCDMPTCLSLTCWAKFEASCLFWKLCRIVGMMILAVEPDYLKLKHKLSWLWGGVLPQNGPSEVWLAHSKGKESVLLKSVYDPSIFQLQKHYFSPKLQEKPWFPYMTLGVYFQTHSTRPVAELVLNTSAPHVVVMTSMIDLVPFVVVVVVFFIHHIFRILASTSW